eukprot:m.341224 g.341224  ORF g.341224 m.341224 type:complete len:188 (-) comp19920_c0_seq1:27-590(-)
MAAVIVKATVTLRHGSAKAGEVQLSQKVASDGIGGPVTISGVLTSFQPGDYDFAVCVFGDLSQAPRSCGPIFNPGNHNNETETPSGLLGTQKLEPDAEGNSGLNLESCTISLVGPKSVIGRSLVVFTSKLPEPEGEGGADGGSEETPRVPCSGPRNACGVIGISKMEEIPQSEPEPQEEVTEEASEK